MSAIEIRVPDIGGFEHVPVIEVLVKPGDRIVKDASLVTLESDKASMEVPSNADGVISAVNVKVGDKVSEGSLIVTLDSDSGTIDAPSASLSMGTLASGGAQSRQSDAESATGSAGDQRKDAIDAPSASLSMGTLVSGGAQSRQSDASATGNAGGERKAAQRDGGVSSRADTEAVVHASPGVRRLARELGVDLTAMRGSGPNGRIAREDVHTFVKQALQTRGGGGFPGLPDWPNVDFAKQGEIERVPLSRIKKISGPNLHRNWLRIPHITNYDRADVTDLEAFRSDVNAENTKSGGAKLTMLAFLVKASIAALQRFPEFNASLDGDALVLKRYYNIGFAADTPSGLVVPVLKGADRMGLMEIAAQTASLASKARDAKLGLGEMQGGTFTISSIGGIGGTQFTQIVNAPEVAILGATRAEIFPVWTGAAFEPRLMLPVSVSYDHRVIDGAAAARFLVYLTGLLRDFRRVLL